MMYSAYIIILLSINILTSAFLYQTANEEYTDEENSEVDITTPNGGNVVFNLSQFSTELHHMNLAIAISPIPITTNSVVHVQVEIANTIFEDEADNPLALLTDDCFQWYFQSARINANAPFTNLKSISQSNWELVGYGRSLTLNVDEEIREGILNLTVLLTDDAGVHFRRELTRLIKIQKVLQTYIRVNELSYYEQDWDISISMNKENKQCEVSIQCVYYGVPLNAYLHEEMQLANCTNGDINLSSDLDSHDKFFTILTKRCFLQPQITYHFSCNGINYLSEVTLKFTITPNYYLGKDTNDDPRSDDNKYNNSSLYSSAIPIYKPFYPEDSKDDIIMSGKNTSTHLVHAHSCVIVYLLLLIYFFINKI